MSLKELERRLYQSFLRSGMQFDRLMQSKNGNIEREIRRLGHLYPPNVNRRYDSMRNAVRVSFRESLCFDHEMAFSTMRQLNLRLDVISKDQWKPDRFRYDIGQIFRHKKHKFRLVVIDRFAECPCDEHWIETYGPFEEGLKQPFYKTMICTKDRDPFMSIAAQENLEPIDAVSDGGAVAHPYINQVFEGYDVEGGRMIPRYEWQYGEQRIL